MYVYVMPTIVCFTTLPILFRHFQLKCIITLRTLDQPGFTMETFRLVIVTDGVILPDTDMLECLAVITTDISFFYKSWHVLLYG